MHLLRTLCLRNLRGKPIPARLKCHIVGSGTSVPTGNTDAFRTPAAPQVLERTEDVSAALKLLELETAGIA